jgi:hypothetical protein
MIDTRTVASSASSRFYLAIVTAILMYFGARIVLEMKDLAVAWQLAAAIVPVPFFGWLLVELIRGARSLDEMQKRIQLEALAFAYPVVVMLLMTLGLLELAIPLNRDDWSYRHVWQMQGVIYCLGLFLAYRRYGVDGK